MLTSFLLSFLCESLSGFLTNGLAATEGFGRTWFWGWERYDYKIDSSVSMQFDFPLQVSNFVSVLRQSL